MIRQDLQDLNPEKSCKSCPNDLSLRDRVLHHGDLDLRRILSRMMHGVARDDAFRFIVIVAAGVQVAIEAREVTARHFEANAMAGREEVARRHRLQSYFVDLAG